MKIRKLSDFIYLVRGAKFIGERFQNPYFYKSSEINEFIERNSI